MNNLIDNQHELPLSSILVKQSIPDTPLGDACVALNKEPSGVLITTLEPKSKEAEQLCFVVQCTSVEVCATRVFDPAFPVAQTTRAAPSL